MRFDLDEEEGRVLESALKTYLSDLREEIVKTEKHEWREALHVEEQILNRVLTKLTAVA